MCQSWEFSCGHTSKVECQNYKNRNLIQTGEEEKAKVELVVSVAIDDPFTDNGGPSSTVGRRPSQVQSDPDTNRPPPFFLPSSTSSSVTSDNDVTCPSPRGRRNSTTSNYGLGPAVENTQSSKVPNLPLFPTRDCSGPDSNQRTAPDECYACILRRSKENSAVRQDERAAEARLYEEINGQGAHQPTAPSGVGNRDQARDQSRTPTPRNNPGYVNNATDTGRGNPPRGPRNPTIASTSSNRGRGGGGGGGNHTRGGHHHQGHQHQGHQHQGHQHQGHQHQGHHHQGAGPNRAAAQQLYHPQAAQTQFYDAYHVLAHDPSYDATAMNPYQFAQNQYPQQQNPYAYTQDPYAAGAAPPPPYHPQQQQQQQQQFMYPQAGMQNQMGYETGYAMPMQGPGQGQYEGYEHRQAPYGYFPGM